MKKSYLYLIILFYLINSKIVENPIFLTESKNPYVLSINDDNHYYIITKKAYLKIKKETGEIITDSKNELEKECSFIHDFSYKNYLLCSDKYYTINYNSDFNYIENEYDESFKTFISPTTIVGSMINKNNNDIYIYGYSRFWEGKYC